ncbi:trigger factor [Patescibacteria group bacterium]|nr:trigger factor [Patescibacteria group bacterium]MBU1448850.1 trigger factor [Patescibacteria group bacterium]MBU2613329.1 trigger factor [Patescibacteria group bacterium]
MTPPTITRLPGARVELTFVVTPDEARPYLEQAAIDLQTNKPIQGFRPGKAPYEEVAKAFGEMRVYETALERIVRARYVKTVLDEGIETIGSPAISVGTLVPGQDIAFTVTAPIMPTVLTLAPYDAPIVTRTVRPVKDTDVDTVLEDLRKMRRQEVAADHPVTKDGMALINLEMKKDSVPLEGGSTTDYRIYMEEPHYIPGFTDHILGLSKGDEKTFTVTFPKDHYQKHLAGQEIACSIKIDDVFDIVLPTVDDAFAQGLGMETVAKLHETLRENLEKESLQKADESAEIELLEKIVRGSKFSDVPELLVNEEVRRMFHELEHAAEHQGMNMGDYLSQLKKTADEIKMDMVPHAIERVQTAVMIKDVAKREAVTVDDADVDAEIDRILSGVKDVETRERVSSPDYREYVTAQMRNRKTLDLLKSKAIKDT